MGRFPWSQGHSKQGSDKFHATAHEWFSKESAEPSRQALQELMRDRPAFETRPTNSSTHTRTRSRSNTYNSTFSTYARSSSQTSNEMSSRPSSRQSITDGGMPSHERHETTAKNLLAKGSRMLKRQGSKLNLLPSQIGEANQGWSKDAVYDSGLRRNPTLTSRGTQVAQLLDCSRPAC
jgi:hypothetical protein